MTDVRDVAVTHPERVLWPSVGFTKGAMLAYYEAVAPVLLPYLHARPITLARFPEGVDGKGWYQAQCRGRPPWLPVFEVEGTRGDILRYCLIEELAALRWIANLGTIEVHPFLWTADAPFAPTHLVFDLDPGPQATIADCCRIALRLRPLLVDAGLTPVAKTSGSVGLHVVAGLAPGATFEGPGGTKAFARRIAEDLASADPDRVTARANRAERGARVFVDWVMNDGGRSLIAPYSLRAVTWPLVATPLTWAEVEATAAGGDPRAVYFSPSEVLERIDRLGDVHAPALVASGRLPPPDGVPAP